MEGQLNRSLEANAAPDHPSQFAGHVQRMLGPDCDLDPLFLEESWTLGVASAVESFQRRQQGRLERERQSRASRQLDTVAVLNFIQQKDSPVESLLASRADAIARGYDACRSLHPQASAPHAPDRPAQDSTPPAWTPPAWTPQRWSPQDRVSHSWIPQGWSPLDETPSAPRRDQPAADPSDPGRQTFQPIQRMTAPRARQLLGVTADSTPEQIKSAYRRLVGLWHPDRLLCNNHEAHRRATDRMAALNEAYRLLSR